MVKFIYYHIFKYHGKNCILLKSNLSLKNYILVNSNTILKLYFNKIKRLQY